MLKKKRPLLKRPFYFFLGGYSRKRSVLLNSPAYEASESSADFGSSEATGLSVILVTSSWSIL